MEAARNPQQKPTQIYFELDLLSETESKDNKLKGLILAQNERQRRGLGMQVERTP